MRDAFGQICDEIETIRRKKLKLAATAQHQHQQSFSFLYFKKIEIIQKMDKVEYVDWPTQNVDRDETYILHTLSFNRREPLLNYVLIYIQIDICC